MQSPNGAPLKATFHVTKESMTGRYHLKSREMKRTIYLWVIYLYTTGRETFSKVKAIILALYPPVNPNTWKILMFLIQDNAHENDP